MRLGFNIGSLYFDMDETDGVIGEENNFRLTAGMNIGYRF